jgi:hypothetical protein
VPDRRIPGSVTLASGLVGSRLPSAAPGRSGSVPEFRRFAPAVHRCVSSSGMILRATSNVTFAEPHVAGRSSVRHSNHVLARTRERSRLLARQRVPRDRGHYAGSGIIAIMPSAPLCRIGPVGRRISSSKCALVRHKRRARRHRPSPRWTTTPRSPSTRTPSTPTSTPISGIASPTTAQRGRPGGDRRA